MNNNITQDLSNIKSFIENLKNTFNHNDIEKFLIYYYLTSNNLKSKFEYFDIPAKIDHNLFFRMDSFFKGVISIYDLAFLFEHLFEENVKTSNGIVFTPKYISEFIIKNVLKDIKLNNDIKILDPACGTGIFLLVALDILSSKLNKSKLQILKENLFGIDILEENISRTKLILKLACFEEDNNFEDITLNIKQGDSLLESWNEIFYIDAFDIIIGNPPYVNPHDLSKETTLFLKKNFFTTKSGTFNIFYAFIEKSLNFIKNTGKVSFIIPNNFLTISSAKNLRNFLTTTTSVEYILDFTSNLVFKPIRSYNLIIVLSNCKKEKLKYSLIPYTDNIEQRLQELEILEIDYDHLNENNWNLLSKNTLDNIYKIENSGLSIKNMIKIGVATLKDKLYIIDGYNSKLNLFYKFHDEKTFYIEPEIVKPIYKVSNIKEDKDITTYRDFIIFPYEKNYEEKFSIINENKLKNIFPHAYEYFLNIKSILDTRDKGKANPVAWYAYGRTQGINNYGRKLLYPTFSNFPKFSLINDEDTLFFNGYAIFETSEIDLEILQKILNSKVMKYYIDNTSYPIEGGYMCYQKKFIQNFTVPYFTKKEKEFLKNTSNKFLIDEFLFKKYELNSTFENYILFNLEITY